MAITFVAAGAEGTTTIPIPAGIANNDILIACWVGGNTSLSGYTTISSSGVRVAWKRTTGTESAPSNGAGMTAMMYAFRGVNTTTAIDAVGTAGSSTDDTTPTATAVTTVTANAMVIAVFDYGAVTSDDVGSINCSFTHSSGPTTNAGGTANASVFSSPDTDAWGVALFYALQAVAGSSGTETVTVAPNITPGGGYPTGSFSDSMIMFALKDAASGASSPKSLLTLGIGV